MITGFENLEPRVHPEAFVAWNAQVSGDVELGEDLVDGGLRHGLNSEVLVLQHERIVECNQYP